MTLITKPRQITGEIVFDRPHGGNPCSEITLGRPEPCNLLFWNLEDMVGTHVETVQPPQNRWWTFDYKDKPREALVFGPNIHGNIFCWTPDGFRSFHPEQMIGIEDVTCLTT